MKVCVKTIDRTRLEVEADCFSTVGQVAQVLSAQHDLPLERLQLIHNGRRLQLADPLPALPPGGFITLLVRRPSSQPAQAEHAPVLERRRLRHHRKGNVKMRRRRGSRGPAEVEEPSPATAVSGDPGCLQEQMREAGHLRDGSSSQMAAESAIARCGQHAIGAMTHETMPGLASDGAALERQYRELAMLSDSDLLSWLQRAPPDPTALYQGLPIQEPVVMAPLDSFERRSWEFVLLNAVWRDASDLDSKCEGPIEVDCQIDVQHFPPTAPIPGTEPCFGRLKLASIGRRNTFVADEGQLPGHADRSGFGCSGPIQQLQLRWTERVACSEWKTGPRHVHWEDGEMDCSEERDYSSQCAYFTVGDTAVHLAVRNRRFHVLESLAHLQPDLDLCNIKGWSAEDEARRNGCWLHFATVFLGIPQRVEWAKMRQLCLLDRASTSVFIEQMFDLPDHIFARIIMSSYPGNIYASDEEY